MQYNKPEFDPIKQWIFNRKNRPNKNVTWDDMLLACKPNEQKLEVFLDGKVEDDGWPQMNVEEWKGLIRFVQNDEEEKERLARENGAAIIHDDGQLNGASISGNADSAWQKYKQKLVNDHFDSATINEIERATYSILKRLSLDTTESAPIKGLVVGNVQSGKTANMAALMAMAADCGWNMFVVLSGTIESLRLQTERRLFNDLNRGGNIIWGVLEHPDPRCDVQNRACSKNFSSNSHCRYFTVSLKNKTRLKNLLLWMQEDPEVQKNMKVLVIDDESDQAGINTADVDSGERKAINSLITNMVNGKAYNGGESNGHFQAMNYVGYTATPYANVLNESGTESLYPKDFIATLCVSNQYFGPQQIFGCEVEPEFEGLDIVRTISVDDLSEVTDIHNENSTFIPQSLQDAICWFLCGVACLRYWNYKKPISMLIHTSQKTTHHNNVASAVEKWIKSYPTNAMLDKCEDVWEEEVSRFTISNFRDQYPNYGRDNVRDYPTFEDIKDELRTLLNGPLTNIPVEDDHNPNYHEGIHLCIDNCKNNGINDENMMVRLIYPERNMHPAPAFIVIGGATLSRGLTIEGLISTYFLRSVKQSDTLMQMGRWFGYRKGYELIPRIWMTTNTERQFKFLSFLDQSLRNEIHKMDVFGIHPSEYGPRVVNTPMASFIRIVAKNKMQKAQNSDRDFSGVSSQTTLFDNNADILRSNLDATRSFIMDLGQPEEKSPINSHAKNTVIWREVPCEKVISYLKSYSFQERQSTFHDIGLMTTWIQEMTDNGDIGSWNVVLAGKSDGNSYEPYEIAPGIHVTKISRAQKIKGQIDGVLNIGVLRNPKDIVADVDLDKVSDTSVKQSIKDFKTRYAAELREKAGLKKTPQLLIYIVDKDSCPTKSSTIRCSLNAKEDVVGLSLTIPGESRYSNNVATVSVLIDKIDINNNETDITDGN